MRVDCQQRLAEREIDFHRGTISAYRKRLYAGLQNPIKLYSIGEYKERAGAAKESIANAREQIRNLQPIRVEVKRLIEGHRVELVHNLRDERHITRTLNRAVEQESELRLDRAQELPGAEFNGSELKRLEENATTLRDRTCSSQRSGGWNPTMAKLRRAAKGWPRVPSAVPRLPTLTTRTY